MSKDNVRWTSAGETHQGNVRPVNEDSFVVNQESGCWVVADGMGGHSRGDIASQMIGSAVSATEFPEPLEDAVEALKTAISTANTRLITLRDRDPRGRISGSTVAALILRGTEGAAVWVGDSRVYRLRDGQLEQLTRDHTRVAEMVAAGILKAKDAERHPEANVVTRAVGAEQDIGIDTVNFEVSPDDRFLLCTDGLYREIDSPELTKRLKSGAPSSICKRLMARALTGRAADNLTTIVVTGGVVAESSA